MDFLLLGCRSPEQLVPYPPETLARTISPESTATRGGHTDKGVAQVMSQSRVGKFPA